MINASRHDDPLHDFEALIRSAGHYVQPSTDLRPSVLEAARAQRGERWIQGWMRQAAILLVFLGAWTTVLHSQSDVDFDLVREAETQPGDAFSQVDPHSFDPGWSMVESLTRLRRRQAQILGCDL